MRPKDRQKMCSHCEGRIAIESMTCPYCGTLCIGDSTANSQAAMSSQESLSSLYPPPYSNRNSFEMKTDKDFGNKFKAPQASVDNPFGKMPFQANASSLAVEKEKEEKAGFMPLLLVLLGSNLLTLGLMQGMFSEGGFLRLEWSSKYWFFYCLFSLPMIYFGIKKIGSAKEAP